jgi:glyoxylase-like metal-dependent hydrolase (beta-lactamase superfamily II)
MRIGSYDVDLIETGRYALDGGAMFGVVPKNLWARAYPHVDDQNRITMSVRALLIRGNGRTIVADAGVGTKMSSKLASIYALDYGRFTLEGELARHGVSTGDVTDFIYTHLHFDHAGGSTRYDAERKAVPVFPNARHYVQADQLTWARSPSDKDRASYLPENWEPVAERGLLDVLDGDGELFPGVELRIVHGHTSAMQMVIVPGGAGEQGMCFATDLVPTVAHLPYPYIMGYDNHPLTTLEEKKRLLPEFHERNLLIAFIHDAFTDAVRIAPVARGFEAAERIGMITTAS